jgi:hypothetical protein
MWARGNENQCLEKLLSNRFPGGEPLERMIEALREFSQPALHDQNPIFIAQGPQSKRVRGARVFYQTFRSAGFHALQFFCCAARSSS